MPHTQCTILIEKPSKMMLARGGSFKLLHPNPEVTEVLDITGLVDIFDIVK